MFKNRQSAGRKLGQALRDYKQDHPVVLAIPRGGVEVGYYVAESLNCDLSALISRKLGFPDHPEAAFGALAEDGSLYFDPHSQQLLTREMIESVVKKTEKEIDRRILLYRAGHPLPSLKDRTVILIDDGIATGSTMFAAIELCKKKQARPIVVAAPVSGQSMLQRLAPFVDDVIILETPESFFAVSHGYEEFRNLTDEEVQHFLDTYRKQFNIQNSQ